MKIFVALLGLLAVATAERFTGEIDWANVKPIEEFPHYWTRIPRDVLTNLAKAPEAGGRITNGNFATPHQFPFQIVLLSTYPQGQGLCGGSLISKRYVLSAGHCVDGATGGTVILGAHNYRDNSEKNLKITFKKADIKQHENYISSTIRNDLSLIRLSEDVQFSDKIQPSKLPSWSQANQQFENEVLTVSGWGRYSDSSQQTSETLRFVSNPCLPNPVCQQTFGSNLIQSQNICMNGSGGRSSCNGDSGGPLTVNAANGKIQVGVVSFGSAAGCSRGYPGVYARLTYFLKWIENNSDVVISA